MCIYLEVILQNYSRLRRRRVSDSPAVVHREHIFLQDMLRHDAVKHRSDAIDGHVGVTHPQDSIKLSKDEGHGRQRRGFSKHLHHGNATNLQTVKKTNCGVEVKVHASTEKKTECKKRTH